MSVGFNGVDSRTYATIATLHNHGIFTAGGMLVGSHAYGVILNRMGIRGTRFTTDDVDLDRKAPSTAFREVGRSRFRVDLLVPSRDESFPIVPVPELKAYALGLSYLDYLLAESQMGGVIAREGCCPVRVPFPERFALHKLVVSQRRKARELKSQKDLLQAATLCAALAEMHPGALEEASVKLPKKAQKHLRRGLEVARPLLANHPRVFDELGK